MLTVYVVIPFAVYCVAWVLTGRLVDHHPPVLAAALGLVCLPAGLLVASSSHPAAAFLIPTCALIGVLARFWADVIAPRP